MNPNALHNAPPTGKRLPFRFSGRKELARQPIMLEKIFPRICRNDFHGQKSISE
jgi:hypothetical protein